MNVGKDIKRACKEAKDKATRQERAWYVYGNSIQGFWVEPDLRLGGKGMGAEAPVFTALPGRLGGQP